ncbi:hypothetical protein CCMSSC00406_0007413 [Pleurotus cornucopiae]|uniref:Uncharacterized protein n=1 Tax=Pleurotus cornucopiae TaxID=5321 RepID=A0ACB7J4Z9_PLECO|nr:hypothetical protein CCMSSC00406_0007413 [Pleurotus cornucopiae]
MVGTELANPRARGMSLPAEVIIKIIGVVEGGHHSKRGQRAPSSLAASTLVSRAWNTLCRPHMFHTVTLHTNTIYPRLSFLHFPAPHLSQYIHELYFEHTVAEGILSKAEWWFPGCFARLKNLRKAEPWELHEATCCGDPGCVCHRPASHAGLTVLEIRECLRSAPHVPARPRGTRNPRTRIRPIPDIGMALRPSSVTITVGDYTNPKYLDYFTWARDCLNSLPYPRSIQELTINVKIEHYIGLREQLYPALSDYEMLSRFLCRLRGSERGGSSSTAVGELYCGDEARELAKLEKGFAPLGEDHVLDVDFSPPHTTTTMPTTDYENAPDDAHSTLLTTERTPLLLRPPSTASSTSSSKRNYSIKISSPSSSTSSSSSKPSSPSPISSAPSPSSSPSTPSPSSSSPSPTSSQRGPVSLRSPPLQWSQIYIILLLQLCEPLTSQSIYPYINDLVRGLPVTRGDEHNVGFYAGLVESLFFLTEALTVLHWSRISDTIGRKPVLLVGLMGLGASTLGFGMARTFVGIVISRCICGMLNGNIGVMKSVMGELTTPANRAQGFALMPVVWSAGATLGPLIGGGLSKPYDRFPPSLSVFHAQFWKDHPYFLPCAAVALFVGAAWVVTALFFRETLHRRPRSPTENGSGPSRTPLSSLLTRRTLVPIANYTLLALLSISINALQPLFLSTPSTLPSPPNSPSRLLAFTPPSSNTQSPHSKGGLHLGIPGLALPPPTIGLILGAFGVLNGLFQACFFPSIVSKFGGKKGVGGLGGGGGFGWMVWALVGVQLALCVLVDMAYGASSFPLLLLSPFPPFLLSYPFSPLIKNTNDVDHPLTAVYTGCIFMFITASAPAHALGATNGLAQTAVSVARAIGPVAASSLFSVSLGWRYQYEYEHQQHSTSMSYTGSGTWEWGWGLVGANMVYIFVVALSGVAVWVGGMLPDTLDEPPDESDEETSECGHSRDGEGECGEVAGVMGKDGEV